MHGCGWLYTSRIKKKYQKEKQEAFLGDAKIMYTKNIILHVPLVLHFRAVKSMSTPPWDQTADSKTCNKTETFDLYRPATGLLSVAENTNKLQKCIINVADL